MSTSLSAGRNDSAVVAGECVKFRAPTDALDVSDRASGIAMLPPVTEVTAVLAVRTNWASTSEVGLPRIRPPQLTLQFDAESRREKQRNIQGLVFHDWRSCREFSKMRMASAFAPTP